MSISIPDAAQLAYQTVLKGDPKIDWAIFQLSTADNALKVQSTGSGLDDLEEEFMDGRIQYAFARVEDPHSNLEKFVQVNWCGEGVPERQKGLFNTYSPQISTFLRNAHLIIQARSEADVTPALIHKRLQEGSGSKYGGSGAIGVGGGGPGGGIAGGGGGAYKPEPIAKVGTSYQKTVVDMAALKAQGSGQSTPDASAPPPAPAARPTPPTFSRPTPAAAPTSSFSRPTPPPPSGMVEPRPTPVSASSPAPEVTSASKSREDDRIGPVGTAYTPVSLPKPGKLGNRWQQAINQPKEEEPVAPAAGGVKSIGSRFGGSVGAPKPAVVAMDSPGGAGAGGKKLTWSERQAEAKRIREQEEIAAREAMSKSTGAPTPPALVSGRSFGVPAPPPMPPRMPSVGGDEEKEHEDEEDWEAPPPPPPMPAAPVSVGATAEDVAPAGQEEDVPPPPPPPPPMPPADAMEEVTRLKSELTLNEPPAAPAPPPVPAGSRPGAAATADKGLCAVAQYDYDAAEDNEISMKEGEQIIHIKQTDPDWWEGTNSSGQTGLFPSNYVEVVSGDVGEEEAPPAPPAPPAPAPAAEEEDEGVPPPPPPPPPMPAAEGGPVNIVDEGMTAIAQYDYEAAEDNEISFKEGDKIVRIVQTDVDWWTGTGPDGKDGLFPANYVEAQ